VRLGCKAVTRENVVKLTTVTICRRLISKRFYCVLMDEYNTSKNCNGDKRVASIGSSESKCLMLVTRDDNSCVNMMSVAKSMLSNSMERPKEFARSVGEED